MNIDDVLRSVSQYETKIVKTMSGALSETVNDMYLAETHEMRRVFDRPNPYTMNALFKKYPRKGEGLDVAGIAFREFGVKGTPAYKYLMPHINGGPRRMKASERALQHVGGIKAGQMTVMGANFPKDAYGNITGGQYTRMLAELDILPGVLRGAKGKAKKRKASNAQFFLYTPKGLNFPVGVAEKRGKDITIMLRFVSKVNYQKRFDFYTIGGGIVAQQFPIHFNRIFKRYFGGYNK